MAAACAKPGVRSSTGWTRGRRGDMMGAMQQRPDTLVTYAITAVVLAIVLAIRWRRTGRALPLRIERLWILPAILGVAVVASFASAPPHGIAWLFCAVAMLLGAALGWQRGRMMRIDVDPDTHRLSQTSSPAALVLILAIVVLRQAARAEGAAVLHLDPIALSDMLLALAFGLIAAQRLEMFLRARRLLREAIPR
jgi:membrane protein CcdC involved in cytochrome C biogenesis